LYTHRSPGIFVNQAQGACDSGGISGFLPDLQRRKIAQPAMPKNSNTFLLDPGYVIQYTVDNIIVKLLLSSQVVAQIDLINLHPLKESINPTIF
jgi:hypothetical protein